MKNLKNLMKKFMVCALIAAFLVSLSPTQANAASISSAQEVDTEESTESAETDDDVEYLFIGDSLFVWMSTMNFGATASSDRTVLEQTGDIYWCCRSGATLHNFKSVVKDTIAQFEDQKEDIVVVYELGGNKASAISKDIKFVKSLIEDGWTVYMTDILPVNDSIPNKYDNDVLDAANEKIYESGVPVIKFNATVKKKYINDTNDGVHFLSKTYKAWYKKIMKKIEASS